MDDYLLTPNIMKHGIFFYASPPIFNEGGGGYSITPVSI